MVKKITSGHSDSDQEMEDVSRTSKRKDVQDDPSGDEEEGGEGEEDEEYEIEEILEAKQGMFPEGRIGYLVKWRGYGEDANSWVDQEDAGNAKVLIDAYWAKNSKKKKFGPRTSEPEKPKAGTAVKGRKSLPVPEREREESSEVEATTTAAAKKRGRASKSKPIELSDDEPEEGPKPKKSKPAAKTAAARRSRQSPEADENGEVLEFQDTSKFRDIASWESLVERVDTVEKDEDDNLWVYFVLNSVGKKKAGMPGLGKCREISTVCRKKMPQKLLEFYEGNLKWRSVLPDDEE